MTTTFPFRYRILVFLFFITFITYLDRICISLVGVRIKSEFHLTNEQFGWVLAAFSVAYAAFEIPSGMLGDRIGQRAVLIRIILWWSFFTILTGFTNGLYSLIAVRFLFGMGEAGAYPTSSGIISRWFPVNETAKGASFLIAGQSAGLTIAPLIIIPIAAAYGWRAPFYVIGVMGILWVMVSIFWFRDNPSEMKNITEKEKDFIENNRRFVAHKPNLPWKMLFKNRSLRTLVAAFFCSQWGSYFFIAWMPVYLQEGKHFSENDVKLFTSSLFICAIGGVISAGFLSDWLVKTKGLRFGRQFLGVSGMGLLAIAVFIAALTDNNTVVAVSLFCGGLCFFSFNGIASYSSCIDMGGGRAGTVAGIMNFFGQTGAFFLAITFGKLADITTNFNASMCVVAAILMIGSLLWLFVDSSQSLFAKQIEVHIDEEPLYPLGI